MYHNLLISSFLLSQTVTCTEPEEMEGKTGETVAPMLESLLTTFISPLKFYLFNILFQQKAGQLQMFIHSGLYGALQFRKTL